MAIVFGVSLSVAVSTRVDARLLFSPSVAVDLAGIELRDGEGKSSALTDILPDGPAILHFWATWCAPCRAELPELAAFARDLEIAGLNDRLLVISVDRGDHARIRRFLRDEIGVQVIEALQDISGRSGSAFRLFGFPSTVMLDWDRGMVSRVAGPLDWSDPDIRAGLRKHLGEPF